MPNQNAICRLRPCRSGAKQVFRPHASPIAGPGASARRDVEPVFDAVDMGGWVSGEDLTDFVELSRHVETAFSQRPDLRLVPPDGERVEEYAGRRVEVVAVVAELGRREAPVSPQRGDLMIGADSAHL